MEKFYKVFASVLLSILIVNCTLTIDNCSSQWLQMPDGINKNVTQEGGNTNSLKFISNNRFHPTQNITNDFICYNNHLLDSTKEVIQDSIITKPVLPDSTNKVIQDSIKKNLNKPVLLSDSSKKIVKDSIITKTKIPGVKTDLLKNVEKIKITKNSITFQPLGLLLFFTNIEYDRAVTNYFSVGGKISTTVFLLRDAIVKLASKKKKNNNNNNDPSNPITPLNITDDNGSSSSSDDDNTKAAINSFKSFGIGTHLRYYPGNKAVEGFFLGIAIESITMSYDEIKTQKNYNSITGLTDTVTTKKNNEGSVWRVEFEIGSKNVFSIAGLHGFTIQWTLGAGAGFWKYADKKGVVPLGSIGFGMGYSF